MSSSIQVQGTNDEANLSKRSACDQGYFDDWAIRYFVERRARRTPLVNRGYFCRVHALRTALASLARELKRSKGCPPSENERLQVVSLGCGYDTTLFQLLRSGDLDGLDVKYCEVDYPALVGRKAATVDRHHHLRDLLDEKGYAMTVVGSTSATTDDETRGCSGGEGASSSGSASTYFLVGQDLSQVGELENALLQECALDERLPTVFVSECVLNYIKPTSVHAILDWIPRTFADAGLLVCDYLGPHDGFGVTMMKTLGDRGCPLLAIEDFPSCTEIERRYAEHSWSKCTALTMADTYYLNLDDEKFEDVERKELFDEYEDWHSMCCHYTFTWALCRRSSAAPGKLEEAAAVLPRRRLRGPGYPISRQTYRLEVVGAAAEEASLNGAPGRWGLDACISDGALCLFGGFGKGLGGGHQRLNDVVRIDVRRLNGGDALDVRREPPSNVQKEDQKALRRMYHSISAAPGGFFIFGGRAGPQQGYNDVIRVRCGAADAPSFERMRCEGVAPCSRWRHTMTNLGEEEAYLVVGGWDGEKALNDFHVLEQRGGSCRWHGVERTGEDLDPLFGHTVDLVSRNGGGGDATRPDFSCRLVLFGGFDGSKSMYNSVYSLELQRDSAGRWKAEVAALSRAGPDPRYSHASFVKSNPPTLVVVGGVTLTSGDDHSAFAFDLTSLEWTKVRFERDGVDIWARQKLLPLPASADEAGNGQALALVGGGLLCFSFGSKFNPLVLLLRISPM
ncbi:leucine carboxyl methyltransferase [Chloropicon primus]|uniref:tRNA wybutosine-synthesizing protein 4 n=2 Tax=Chloropicon primus TaxID=1764295 RepID=A0A5B8ML19_9CHLO|nr:leucine carboxyl methyltransferase [Chloropicon primus]UPR00182.1 leucine carboxyl methyltransferase [Chloropicon primus]|eukprot:QDZ20971.1 leucine carboxyl methyltransferase [Chloropicon primus]